MFIRLSRQKFYLILFSNIMQSRLWLILTIFSLILCKWFCMPLYLEYISSWRFKNLTTCPLIFCYVIIVCYQYKVKGTLLTAVGVGFFVRSLFVFVIKLLCKCIATTFYIDKYYNEKESSILQHHIVEN